MPAIEGDASFFVSTAAGVDFKEKNRMKASHISGFSAALVGLAMMVSSPVVRAGPQCTQQQAGQFRYSYYHPTYRYVYRCELTVNGTYMWLFWDTQYCPGGSSGPCYSV